MKIKKINDDMYSDIDNKYFIAKNFDGEWDVYECLGRTDNSLYYHCTYKYLIDAKTYIESVGK